MIRNAHQTPGRVAEAAAFRRGGSMNDLHLAPETLDRRALLRALRALKKGDFTTRLPLDLTGIDGQIAEVFNDIVEMNESIASELARVCKTVGKEGQINQRLRVAGVVGAWAGEMDSVNQLIGDLARPTAAVARVIESVADGDLSQRMLLEIDGLPLRGEFQRIGKVVNTMVTQLNAFASEVSRVAREVGTEGKLGGRSEERRVGKECRSRWSAERRRQHRTDRRERQAHAN